jgi:hypothetical protein
VVSPVRDRSTARRIAATSGLGGLESSEERVTSAVDAPASIRTRTGGAQQVFRLAAQLIDIGASWQSWHDVSLPGLRSAHQAKGERHNSRVIAEVDSVLSADPEAPSRACESA